MKYKFLLLVLITSLLSYTYAEMYDFSSMSDAEILSIIEAATEEMEYRNSNSDIEGESSEDTWFKTEVVYSVVTEEGFYGIVQVTNTGNDYLNLSADTFDINDNEGHLIATENTSIHGSPSVLAPGEIGYLYTEIPISLPSSFDPDKGYEFIYSTDYVYPIIERSIENCEVTDVSRPDDSFAEITGRVNNHTERDLEVEVIIEFFSSDNQIVALGWTVADVDAKSNASFDYYNPYLLRNKDIMNYRIWAREIIFGNKK